MAAIAVVDIGKTNIKVVLFEPDGRMLWEKSAPNKPVPAPPYVHFDIEAIWSFLLSALAEGNRTHPVDCIVPTAHGASAVLIGEKGLAMPMLDYEDKAPEEIEPDYARIRPRFNETLSPPAAGGLNAGRQVAYQKWRFPAEFSQARALLGYAQYWSWRMTGVAASELTALGCHTDLWNPRGRCVSSLVPALGLEALIPPVQAAWDTLGPIDPVIAAATGLDPRTRVLCGIHDSNASLIPHLLGRQAPFTVVSTGTWVILLSVGLEFETLDQASDIYSNVDALGRPVPCARFMGGREYQHIAGVDGGSPSSLSIERVIASGTLALPSFTGQGGPYAGRKGEIIGPIAGADRPALASLYVALMTDDLLNRLGASMGDLVIEGSFGRNVAFAELLAALRPKQRVLVSADQAGTARGAALLATWPKAPFSLADSLATPVTHPGLEDYRRRWQGALGHKAAVIAP
jgi:sugar (pentulose or hexulose) kinase